MRPQQVTKPTCHSLEPHSATPWLSSQHAIITSSRRNRGWMQDCFLPLSCMVEFSSRLSSVTNLANCVAIIDWLDIRSTFESQVGVHTSSCCTCSWDRSEWQTSWTLIWQSHSSSSRRQVLVLPQCKQSKHQLKMRLEKVESFINLSTSNATYSKICQHGWAVLMYGCIHLSKVHNNKYNTTVCQLQQAFWPRLYFPLPLHF